MRLNRPPAVGTNGEATVLQRAVKGRASASADVNSRMETAATRNSTPSAPDRCHCEGNGKDFFVVRQPPPPPTPTPPPSFPIWKRPLLLASGTRFVNAIDLL